MKKIKIYLVDAFTEKTFGGNTAGVVLEADALAPEEMQQVAKELNMPESAFLLKTSHDGADFKVRYFTPKEEINFCGHATVGLSWVMATELGWSEKAERIVLETNIGLVPVEWKKEDNRVKTVEMTQISPKIKEVNLEKSKIAHLLGMDAADFDEELPIMLANTGNWHLMIPVRSDTAIDAAAPQLKELADFNRRLEVSTTHLFTLHTVLEGYDVYTRDFAPAVGIPEDPVTGSANGALIGYLYLNGILASGKKHQLTIGQGHAAGRPGTLIATLEAEDAQPVIKIAGSAVIAIAGELTIQ